MPYTPHDWSPGTWALMLTCMVLFVLAIAATYLLLVYRSYETTKPSAQTAPEPAEDLSQIPTQPETAEITHDELVSEPVPAGHV